MTKRRLMAVDPSLTCSGWAIFLVNSGRLAGVGKIRSLPARYTLSNRLADLQVKIKGLLDDMELGSNDVLVCEAQTTMIDPRAAFAVEQVRGIFETLARERNISVPGRLNPRSVQYEVLGLKGKQSKREIVKSTAIRVTKSLYGDSLSKMGFELHEDKLKKHQDIIDAILLGALGLTRVKSAGDAGLPLEDFFSQNRRTTYKTWT